MRQRDIHPSWVSSLSLDLNIKDFLDEEEEEESDNEYEEDSHLPNRHSCITIKCLIVAFLALGTPRKAPPSTSPPPA